MRTRAHGFTVTELLVTLVIVAILLSIAAPSYRDYIVESRVSAGASELVAAMQFARTEAVKRNGRVTICTSGTGTACAPAGTSDTWANGWMVYVDADEGAGGTYEYDSSVDTILRVHGALAEGSTITADANVASYLSYLSDGRSQLIDGASQAGTIGLCVTGSTVQGRDISLARGWVQVGNRVC